MTLKLQTREQHYNEEKAKYDAADKEQSNLPPRLRKLPPMPEIINKDTITHRDAGGGAVHARDADHNGGDVRYIDEKEGLVTPWCKTKEEAEQEKNYLAQG